MSHAVQNPKVDFDEIHRRSEVTIYAFSSHSSHRGFVKTFIFPVPRKLQPYRGTWSDFIHDPPPSTVGLFWNSDCFPEFQIIAHIVGVGVWVGDSQFPSRSMKCLLVDLYSSTSGEWACEVGFPVSQPPIIEVLGVLYSPTSRHLNMDAWIGSCWFWNLDSKISQVHIIPKVPVWNGS